MRKIAPGEEGKSLFADIEGLHPFFESQASRVGALDPDTELPLEPLTRTPAYSSRVVAQFHVNERISAPAGTGQPPPALAGLFPIRRSNLWTGTAE